MEELKNIDKQISEIKMKLEELSFEQNTLIFEKIKKITKNKKFFEVYINFLEKYLNNLLSLNKEFIDSFINSVKEHLTSVPVFNEIILKNTYVKDKAIIYYEWDNKPISFSFCHEEYSGVGDGFLPSVTNSSCGKKIYKNFSYKNIWVTDDSFNLEEVKTSILNNLQKENDNIDNIPKEFLLIIFFFKDIVFASDYVAFSDKTILEMNVEEYFE
jgi:hypothetical protein